MERRRLHEIGLTQRDKVPSVGVQRLGGEPTNGRIFTGIYTPATSSRKLARCVLYQLSRSSYDRTEQPVDRMIDH